MPQRFRCGPFDGDFTAFLIVDFLSRQTEVAHLGVTVLRDEHVPRGQIAVDDFLRFQVLHARAGVTKQDFVHETAVVESKGGLLCKFDLVSLRDV